MRIHKENPQDRAALERARRLRVEIFKGLKEREFDRAHVRKVTHNQKVAEALNELSRVEGHLSRLHGGTRDQILFEAKRQKLRAQLQSMKPIE